LARGRRYPVNSFAAPRPTRAARETAEYTERRLRHGGCSNGTWEAAQRSPKGVNVMLSTILIVVLVLMVLGAIPTWPHSRGWGYFPSGLLGIVLLVFLILALTGRV
jgi:Protein of unknown function (DUF3309)